MGKKEQHSQDLRSLIDAFLEDGKTEKLTGYLLSNSNLPGPRGNLELAAAFGDVIEERLDVERVRLWQLCTSFTSITVDQAPVNTPEVLLPFCGAIGLSVIGSISPQFYDEAIRELRILASDPRWRLREAVCFGVQRLLAKRSDHTLRKLEGWLLDGNMLEMRAVAASLAEPSILENEGIAATSLQLHEEIFKQVLKVEDRKAECFKVVRKALGYTLSVVVCAIPEEGFEFMERLVASRDPDILWIVKQNIKKNRLVKNYPQEVEAIRQLL